MASRGGVLAAVADRPRELLDDLDLRDRVEDVADELQKRSKDLSKDLRQGSQQAAKRTRELTGDALELAEDLRERVGDPRERAEELREAAIEAAETARERAEDLQPLVRRCAANVLQVFHGLLGVLLVVPRLMVSGLGALADLVDRAEVAGEKGREKGHELAERARDAAHAVPPSRRMRWKRRCTNAGLVGGGFAIGFAVGWFAARRAAEEPAEYGFEDAPADLQPVGEPLRPVDEDEPTQPGTGTGT